MFDSHLATWQAETAVPASERAWLAWIGRVEALLGHSADGDQRTDGYSMDGFYELWQRGRSPELALVLIRRLTINAEYLVRTANDLDYGHDPTLDVAKDAASRIGGYDLPLDSDLCVSSYTPVADYRQGN